MNEILDLISSCEAILGRIISMIELASQAWDCTEEGNHYLGIVAIQIKITLRILEEIVKVEAYFRHSEVFSAVALIKEKAEELNLTLQNLTRYPGERGGGVFHGYVFQGNNLAEHFGKPYQNLYRAQNFLIISLAAQRISNTNVFHINIEMVDQIKEWFSQCQGMSCEPPILRLLKKKRIPARSDILWQVFGEDLEALERESQPSKYTIDRDASRHQPLLLHPHNSIYYYTSLPAGYIRVAELYPGQFNDEVVIKLHLQPLKSYTTPVYEALSYFWGSRANPSWVRVAGTVDSWLQMTRNLDIALRHLRYIDRVRFLWIDAICIDQSNDVEKGPQVAMIGDIFRLAARVVAWLGPEDNYSDRAMACMEYLGSQIDYSPESGLSPVPGAHDMSIGDHAALLPLGADDLWYVNHLLYRPWFERLWVRQEILLANNGAIVLCGSFAIPWELFRRGCACVYLKNKTHFNGMDQLEARIGVVKSLFYFSRRHGLLPLSHVQGLFGILKCQDPRDRVYGILALLHKYGLKTLDIQPDYTKSFVQVYQDLVAHYVNNTSGLNILTECRFSNLLSGPSWLPAWSRDTSPISEDYSLGNPMSFASGHFSTPRTSCIAGELQVWGVSVGRIQRLRESRVGLHAINAETIEAIQDAFFFPPRLISSDYIAGGTLLEACTRTICRDFFYESYFPFAEWKPKQLITEELLGKLLHPSESVFETPDLMILLREAGAALRSRCVYETESGFIGIAPLKAKVGDQICVLLGCDVPVVLRRVDEGKYILIGASYTCGIGGGEALLGPLPKHIRRVVVEGNVPWSGKHMFVDSETGTHSIVDPRVKEWPINHEEYHKQLETTYKALSCDPEDFRAKGVAIQSFTLI